MKGAIFYASKYGSTAEYAEWISDATGLPVFDVINADGDPSDYDFLVLGSPIIYHRLMFHKWAGRHEAEITSRPAILFSVSGAGAGAKLDGWIAKSLSAELTAHLDHVALLGRQDPKELSRFDRLMLIAGGLMNRDRVARKEELHGFDYMDKSSIEPIIAKIRHLQTGPYAEADTQALTT